MALPTGSLWWWEISMPRRRRNWPPSFGRLEDAQTAPAYAVSVQPVAAVNQSIKTPDKANASIMLGMTIDIGDEHSDYAAMVIGNYMLGIGHELPVVPTRAREGRAELWVGSQFMCHTKRRAVCSWPTRSTHRRT